MIDQLERLDAGAEGGDFAGRVDLARVATFGHSYGGNVAVEACARDARVKACLNADGGAFGR
ncbi:MAG: carboxylic ester hydrolase, partial [Actinobacteria bacterium]|nr:carboxylic ester hydrolase [Actinomycetota bacterium]NIS32245.1 carboxylic ester hydrolase [Actinomycetota bacterium]NIV87824.1 carboxylic ester hydrolase [Actinomycetota bacterium]NIW29078.1 carboxylic ester hydrolase [Actinomycetota bacterium]